MGRTHPKLKELGELQRTAQWRLDFIAAKNSMGFHASQEMARILGDSIDLSRQAEIRAVALAGGKLPPVLPPEPIPASPTPELERLGDVPLNIVCFRYRPPGVPESALDELNRRVGAMVLEDGRVFFGTTEYQGQVAFRPAIVNWRTTEKDVDLIVEVVRQLGPKLLPSVAGSG